MSDTIRRAPELRRKTPRGGMLVNDCSAKTFGRFKCPCCRPEGGAFARRIIKRRERQKWKRDVLNDF